MKRGESATPWHDHQEGAALNSLLRVLGSGRFEQFQHNFQNLGKEVTPEWTGREVVIRSGGDEHTVIIFASHNSESNLSVCSRLLSALPLSHFVIFAPKEQRPSLKQLKELSERLKILEVDPKRALTKDVIDGVYAVLQQQLSVVKLRPRSHPSYSIMVVRNFVGNK